MTSATNTTEPASAIVEADEPEVSREQGDHLSTACCTDGQPKATAAFDDVKAHEIAPEEAVLRSTGFKLLLDQGLPVELDEWADAAGVDKNTIKHVLEKNTGRVQLDEQGRLIGIAGLTIEPSGHELDISGKKRWTWCALDAVGIFGALETTGTIRSTDPRTNETVTIEFINGQPQGDATIFILGSYDGGNAREEWCPSSTSSTLEATPKSGFKTTNSSATSSPSTKSPKKPPKCGRPLQNKPITPPG